MVFNLIRRIAAKLQSQQVHEQQKETKKMAKVLILYYSSYGHIEQMAYAVAEGAKAEGAEVVVKRVPETVPEDVAKGAHFKLDQAAPVATVDELAE